MGGPRPAPSRGISPEKGHLSHASCAILVWLKAPAAALVAAAAVPTIGVDADGLVPGTDEGELSALICVYTASILVLGESLPALQRGRHEWLLHIQRVGDLQDRVDLTARHSS